MNNTLVLLAGYPGTGKSYLCNIIMSKYKEFYLLSPDNIKEYYWDKYGFNDLKEKEELIQKSWVKYYELMEVHMKNKECIISDYPFSEKQKDKIDSLSKKYNYRIITIRMIADIDVLFERQKQRDLLDDRHLGHILSKYQKGVTINDRINADGILSYEEFSNRCKYRGYDKFELGSTYELDVTDYTKINYDEFINNILGDSE